MPGLQDNGDVVAEGNEEQGTPSQPPLDKVSGASSSSDDIGESMAKAWKKIKNSVKESSVPALRRGEGHLAV
jgi:hypothetical protein